MESVLSENDARVQRKIRQVMADVVKQIAQGEEPVLKCDETLVRFALEATKQ